MAITFDFEYDPARNVLFTVDHGDLKTQEDVDEFFEEYLKHLQSLGKKVFVVSNIDDLMVHAPISQYYGQRAQETTAYILNFARWGDNDMARMTVRTTSRMANIPANIHYTREEAVQAVLKTD